MISSNRSELRSLIASLCLVSGLAIQTAVQAEIFIGDVCRIKGQEENVLHGIGLVGGLKGTGDDSLATKQALARYMQHMGHHLPTDAKGRFQLDDLKGVKNVALVAVQVVVPASGVQQGDILPCTVSAIGAKSLEGGQLWLTELFGPIPGDRTVFGLAQGPILIDDVVKPQVGQIARGCQIERKIRNEFVKDGKMTLVVNKSHAGFATAYYIAARIKEQPDLRGQRSTGEEIARAIDQVTIEVTIPPVYADYPAHFATLIMQTRFYQVAPNTSVIINERQKAIIVGANVEIAPIAVMHAGRLIQVGSDPSGQFVPVNLEGDAAIDPSNQPPKPKLTALVDALNALKVPAEDMITIVKMLKSKGALYGELIYE
jgi:flagellar P-ring protein precursor FlgI